MKNGSKKLILFKNEFDSDSVIVKEQIKPFSNLSEIFWKHVKLIFFLLPFFLINSYYCN